MIFKYDFQSYGAGLLALTRVDGPKISHSYI